MYVCEGHGSVRKVEFASQDRILALLSGIPRSLIQG